MALRPNKSPARSMAAKKKSTLLPVRLGILVLATLGLGSFSLRQFSGRVAGASSKDAEFVRLGAATAAQVRGLGSCLSRSEVLGSASKRPSAGPC